MLMLKTKLFQKWAKNLNLHDEVLNQAIREIADGLYDAYLGSDVYKKRVPIGNKGKRSGARTIVALKKGDKAFLMYGYAKNARENITNKDEKALIKYAKDLFAMDAQEITKMISKKMFIEVQ